jgi:hypothetical protein
MVILLPTDFSLASQQAFEYTLSFLKESSKIFLLNTYVVPASEPEKIINIHDELRRKSKDGLQAELKRIQNKKINPALSFETLSHMGTLENVLPHLVKTRQIDFVVVGVNTDENRNSSRLFHLISILGCPLVTVPYPRVLSSELHQEL